MFSRVAIAGAIGGLAARISGGRLWSGFQIGAFQRLFNDESHGDGYFSRRLTSFKQSLLSLKAWAVDRLVGVIGVGSSINVHIFGVGAALSATMDPITLKRSVTLTGRVGAGFYLGAQSVESITLGNANDPTGRLGPSVGIGAAIGSLGGSLHYNFNSTVTGATGRIGPSYGVYVGVEGSITF